MDDLALNLAAAARVTAHEYGPEQTDAEGTVFRPVIGVRPGVRIDVQSQCLAHHPALAAFVVEPDALLHDCGPNGVRLFAENEAELKVAAPPSAPASVWDLFYEPADEMGL